MIAATLALTTPVSCVPAAQWPAVVAQHYAAIPAGGVGAFYLPAGHGGPRIILGPTTCRMLRELTHTRPAQGGCSRKVALRGVTKLAHELAHAWQDEHGLPFDEGEADRIAARTAPGMLRRLERAFRVRCQ